MFQSNFGNYWNSDDLDPGIINFDAIQEEINYKKAQNAMRGLVNHLDLTKSEQVGLETELNHLTTMLEKLEQSLVQIAAFGMVGRGKSSILNSLLGQAIFETGPLHGVTKTVDNANWQFNSDDAHEGIQRLELPGWGSSQIQLIDTPGIDEVGGQTREVLAHKIAKQVDLILFIIAGDMTNLEYETLCQLREVGKPMILAFNKIDQYPEADRLTIYQKIRDDRVRELLSPDEIVMVAASPLVTEVIKNQGGNLKQERKRGKPQIEALKLKILEILHREGKSLIALNTMLYASEINEQIVERKLIIREEAANKLIQKAVIVKAVAIAFNPVTVFDLLTGAVVDLSMILALSRLYGVDMTQQGAIALLQRIGISMGSITGSEFLASFSLSSLKSVLGLATPVTGGISLLPYISVAVTQGAVAGTSCYTIGQVTKRYLANGASWGPKGPKTVVKSILSSLDQSSILNRIKWELGAKLKQG
ncbi:GTP-binding protein [Cyanobacterium sp. uoEpiScrs1]|uniref:GTP-binding protein n=1 Tax=Cyanobacterium sp. uoEpiScrs1 TaxID=2976343 RepID=UPI00226A674D|nr:GTP-binding protein [Cyanobacterium sp. uoEpiScrs1]